MQNCKGLVQSGPRRGERCQKSEVDEDGYCLKHQRCKEYDNRIARGERVCRNFFRGCDSVMTESNKACSACLVLTKVGAALCEHKPSCDHKVESGTKYCGKHRRDAYRDLEQAKNTKLCNIERGCFNECEEGFASCLSCISYKYHLADRYFNPKLSLPTNMCIRCDYPFEPSEYTSRTLHCETCFRLYSDTQKDSNIQVDCLRSETVNLEQLLREYRKGATTRNLAFELSESQFQELIQSACFYCGCQPITTNGIDRKQNDTGYTLENCVACCTICNRMKHTLNDEEFKAVCNYIYMYYLKGGASIAPPLAVATRVRSFNEYKTKSTEKRNIPFDITQEQYEFIKSQSCYLCGVPASNGIDRINNLVGYVIENCRPCCKICNNMKADIPIGLVKHAIQNICNKSVLSSNVGSIERPAKPSSIEKSRREIKQWKVKDIHSAIADHRENEYKEYCKTHNDLSAVADWEQRWVDLLAVREMPLAEAEPAIRTFVEWLRTIRHNALCSNRQMERDDRKVWTTEYVIHLFEMGRIEEYKAFTEAQTGDSDEDPKWVQHWNTIVAHLEANKGNAAEQTVQLRKFMAAQRNKKLRRSKM